MNEFDEVSVTKTANLERTNNEYRKLYVIFQCFQLIILRRVCTVSTKSKFRYFPRVFPRALLRCVEPIGT